MTEPQTETGRALKLIADEVLDGAPGMLKAIAMPLIVKMIASADADPERARTVIRPLIVRLARAVELTADELAADIGKPPDPVTVGAETDN